MDKINEDLKEFLDIIAEMLADDFANQKSSEAQEDSESHPS